MTPQAAKPTRKQQTAATRAPTSVDVRMEDNPHQNLEKSVVQEPTWLKLTPEAGIKALDAAKDTIKQEVSASEPAESRWLVLVPERSE